MHIELPDIKNGLRDMEYKTNEKIQHIKREQRNGGGGYLKMWRLRVFQN